MAGTPRPINEEVDTSEGARNAAAMDNVTVANLRAEAEALAAALPAGEPLDPQAAALIRLAVAVSASALDRAGTAEATRQAFDAGSSIAQVQEVIALVSGLGVHSLMISAADVLAEAGQRGLIDPTAPYDAERQALWDRHVGTDPFWTGFSEQLPGFLDAMLRLSPDIFAAFFAYCAVPWTSGTVRARVKELAAMACDVTPTHRFRPGFLVHLHNAIRLGTGRIAILHALNIAAAAPEHRGNA
ncbi:MAG: carboxymuconolactone decarboxylase family protein [Pseudomonadota bacterium]